MPPRTTTAVKPATTNGNGKVQTKDKPKKKSTTKVMAYVFGYDDPITVDKAKTLLGWEEEVKGNFGGDFLLTDLRGIRIRCNNNTNNRPYYHSLALMYAREMLEGKWKLNGEPVTTDDDFQIVSGQHRLIGVVLADQMRLIDKTEGLVPFNWKNGVTFPTVLVTGIDSDDETVNTVDCGKKRSTHDALYRTEMFAPFPQSDRKAIAVLTARALKLVWSRAGVNTVYSPLRSHTESIAFVTRHQKLIKAANFMHTEDGGKRLCKLFPLGSTTGLLYLFGTSTSDSQVYHEVLPYDEENLDFEKWQEAERFFSLIAQSGGASMNYLRKALAKITEDVFAGKCNWEVASTDLLVKAWSVYVSGKPITEHTVSKCDEYKVGGIDMGCREDESEEEAEVNE